MNKEFHVISHTHWDREWYLPFENMRLRLIDLIDNLLDIFEAYPEFIFHLDAQTVCLEDYLEVKPYRRAALERHIREGRLLVGPWYVQNDFNLCSGEATVRNLLIGSTDAAAWGGSQRVGYAPDQFGLVAQLPQIYAGFDIHHALSARGFCFYDQDASGNLTMKQVPVEFDWIGADGTRTSAYNMENWYNNAQRFPADPDKALEFVRVLERDLDDASLSPIRLLMNGVDHIEAQEDLLPILGKLKEHVGIKQSTMLESLKQISEHFQGLEKPEYHGEMRNGKSSWILPGTLSSRPYLKLLNMRCQNLLELVLEPLYSELAFWTDGAVEYPADMLDYLWKELLKNHAHDSICGCSADRVHQDNENRFLRILDAAEDLKRRGLNHLVRRVDREGLDEDGYILTLVNTLPYERSEVVEAELHPLAEDGFGAFRLCDEKGRDVEYELLESEERNRCLITPCNLPGQKLVNHHRIRFDTTVPAGGYRTLRLLPTSENEGVVTLLRDAPDGWTMKNEFLCVRVNPDGKVDLFDAESGIENRDIFSFEDIADAGESYWFAPAPNGESLDCSAKPEVSIVENRRARISYPFGVELNLSLDPGCRHMNINVVVDNCTENHRLRLLVHTDVESTDNLSAQPFDVIKRSSIPDTPALRCEWTEPNSGMVSVTDDHKQMSIFNDGMYEYEHLNDGRGTVALTLMRSTGLIAIDPMDSGDGLAPDPLWAVPENQCLRTVSYRLGIRPGRADAATLMREMQCFQVPVLAVFDAVDSRKFSGGRPFNSHPATQFQFHRLPAEEERTLPMMREGMELDRSVVFSALKKSHDRQAWILRFFNPSENASEVSLQIQGALASDLDERYGAAKWGHLEAIDAKKIVTLRLNKLSEVQAEKDDPIPAVATMDREEALV